MPSSRAGCSAWSSPRRTPAPTGRGGRLSAEEQEYALDDVRHLAALRASLLETLAAKGRLAWLEEELAALANPDALRVAPEDAWRKVKGLPTLDPRPPAAGAGTRRVARTPRRSNAIGRAAGFSTTLSLREIVVRLPRSTRSALGVAGNAGLGGAQVRRGTAGAGARRRHRRSAASRCRAVNARILRRSRW